MPKKPVKSSKSAALVEKKAEPPQPREPQRIIFRYFECLIHIEQAHAQLSKVGIFPPTDENLMAKKAQALELIDELRRAYQTAWADQHKKVGL